LEVSYDNEFLNIHEWYLYWLRRKKQGEKEGRIGIFRTHVFYLFSGRIYIKQANGKKLHFGLSQYKIPGS